MTPNELRSILTSNMTLRERNVFLAFVAQKEEYGQAIMNLSDLTKLFQTTRQDISSTMRKLEENGYIHRLDRRQSGRGASAYCVQLIYPCENSGFTPIDTNPDTASDRRLAESEKARMEAERQMAEIKKRLEEIQQPEKYKSDIAIQDLQKELAEIRRELAERKAAEAKENTPAALFKKLIKSIFKKRD